MKKNAENKQDSGTIVKSIIEKLNPYIAVKSSDIFVSFFIMFLKNENISIFVELANIACNNMTDIFMLFTMQLIKNTKG